MNVACPVAEGAMLRPHHPALVLGSETLSYQALDRKLGSTTRALRNLDIGSGSHVGLLLEPGISFVQTFWALLRLGSVAVLLSRRDPERKIASTAVDAGCRFVVTDWPSISGLETIDPRDLVLNTPDPLETAATRLDLDRHATILFSSGSEGEPKAVVHTLRSHMTSAEGSQRSIPVSPTTRWAVVIPMYHVGGLSILFRCFRFGGTVVIPDSERRNPVGLKELGSTHVSVVPTQLAAWMREGDPHPMSLMECVLVGGAPTPVKLWTQALQRKIPVRITYGSTEMTSQISTTDPNEPSAGAGYVGRILPGREVRVEEGQIQVRGETRFAGYLRGGILVQPFDDDGWFATGDLGRIDGDRLFLTGRRDNMFISGGENIYPEEIEEAILSSGLAEQACVVPVDDDQYGVRPVAFLRPLPQIDIFRAEMLKALPSFKIPDRLYPLPEDARGSKIDRRRLKQHIRRPDRTDG